MKIDRNRAAPLYEQIADLLATQIAKGRYKPFQRLPSEQECMQRWGVSRVTVRQAVALLQRRGVVEVRHGKGSFVAGPVVHHELEELRGFYDTLVTEGLDPTTRLLGFEPKAAPEGIAEALRAAGRPAMQLTRLYSLHEQPFALARAWLPPEAARVSWDEAATHPLYALLQQLLEMQVKRADVGIVACSADADESRLLDVAPGSPVLVMERVSYGADERALECSRFTIRPENYRFCLSVHGPLAITRQIREIRPAAPAPFHSLEENPA